MHNRCYEALELQLPMQLTRFSDYSLGALIYLAQRQGLNTTISEVASAHRISKSHLMKVIHNLAKRGYVRTTRGKGGGISLAHAPEKILLGKVIRDVEPFAPVECFVPNYAGGCRLYANCGIRGPLRSAQLRFLETLDGYSIGDVMGRTPLLGKSGQASTGRGKPPRS
jgi:Rrf2 family transcriptional regulator, nitric oxide-sensitive transcriptional repressor